jgi:hypothetical protein
VKNRRNTAICAVSGNAGIASPTRTFKKPGVRSLCVLKILI